MEKMSLKRQARDCSVFILAGVVLVYVVIVYPLLLFGVMPATHLLTGYYTYVLIWAFVCVLLYFIFPRFIIHRCRNCGSKNMTYSLSKNFFCGDCGYTFNPNRDLNDDERLKFLVWSIGVPFSLFGVCLVVGSALAGIMDSGLVFFGVLLSVWFPSLAVLFVGLLKLSGKAAYVREQKHKGVAATLFFITFIVLGFLMLIGFGMLLKFIFTGST